MIDVRIAPAVAAKDMVLVHELAGLVNRVYAVAEEGLWADDAPRTTPVEMAELIAAGQIAVARAQERIVGAVRVRRLGTGEGEVGMLVADPAHRGTGVGRELIRNPMRLRHLSQEPATSAMSRMTRRSRLARPRRTT